MSKKNVLDEWLKGIDFEVVRQKLFLICIQPYLEVFEGLKYRKSALAKCALVSAALQIIVLASLDWKLMKYFGWQRLYPIRPVFRYPYLLSVVTASFYFWGIYQVILRAKITRWLTDVFQNAGIKSTSGRLPGFIYDKAIDSEIRLLRLKKNGIPTDKFKAEDLKGQLQVEIDRVDDDLPNGAINIYYSHASLEKFCSFGSVDELHPDQFFVGKSRVGTVVADLKQCPHYLVGGTTGSGKSYFLNQMIAALYLKNPKYTFELIDLKYGAEFEMKFSRLPRVNVHGTSAQASRILNRIAETEIKNRAEFLKLNECQNIDELLALPEDKVKISDTVSIKAKFARMIVVIDEAHELYLKSDSNKAEEATKARYSTIKIAAMGRSVGINLFVGTQRPDAKAIDPLIKANLPSRVCFYSANLATSMTILDNGRGAHLPPEIKGRCIWQNGSEAKEVQALFLPNEKVKELLAPYYIEEKEAKIEAVVSGSAPEDLSKARKDLTSTPDEEKQ